MISCYEDRQPAPFFTVEIENLTPMRILYFTRDYTTHDYRFLSALAKTEHQVYYLRLESRGHQLEDRPLPPQIEQIVWKGGQNPARLQHGPRLLADLKRVIRQVKPDIIQAGPLQRSAFLAALTGFHPLISMSWGYDLIHDAHQNVWWRWATRYTLQHSALLIGDSNIIHQLAISFGMPDDRIITFPWGIDLDHFSPPPALETAASGEQKFTSPQGRGADVEGKKIFTLLSTRSWEPLLGADIIAQAFIVVTRKRPDVRLVMAGSGSLAAKLHQTFLHHGLLGEQTENDCNDGFQRVVFPGQVSFRDLPGLYQSADLYIAATHSDGSSISLLEAMACGLPAIVSDIPGNREWITPGENGWLFPDNDADALANAILIAIDQPEQLLQMGQAARQITESRADWNKNFQELLKAFTRVYRRTH